MKLPETLSHAYLITGGSAESRSAVARRLTAAYLCEGEHPPCGQCKPCRKVAAGIHPDVALFQPLEDKREIVVDQVRDLRADAYIRPNEGRRKVYILQPADCMNPKAQNALLKVLEDGPDYAAFLLLAEQPGRLLDTVRSRCEGLNLPPEDSAPDPELRARGAELAELLLRGDELTVAEQMVKLERKKLKSGQVTDLLAEAERQVSGRLAGEEPGRAAAVLRALKRCRENSVYNLNSGHTLGGLAAELFQER